jgi:hypothetical protein
MTAPRIPSTSEEATCLMQDRLAVERGRQERPVQSDP